MSPIPITVLTGYLGAGKTTLLNRILSEDHGRRYAVLVNEFGEVGIDAALLAGASQNILEMANGCVCCTVRGDLLRTLHSLLEGDSSFDAIVLETTGLADPAPVAQALLTDDLVQANCALDSITTVVDAAHVLQRLEDSAEAARQIAFADILVLNKAELAGEEALAAIEARLRGLNPLAPIYRATRAVVPLDEVLGRGGFDLDRIVSLEPAAGQPGAASPAHAQDEQCGHGAHCDHGHTHDHGHSHAHSHDHDHIAAGGISSVSLVAHRPLDYEKLSGWVEGLVVSRGQDLLRTKGILEIAGDDRRLVIQAVHHLLEGDWQQPWRADEARCSRLVFIGRNLN